MRRSASSTAASFGATEQPPPPLLTSVHAAPPAGSAGTARSSGSRKHGRCHSACTITLRKQLFWVSRLSSPRARRSGEGSPPRGAYATRPAGSLDSTPGNGFTGSAIARADVQEPARSGAAATSCGAVDGDGCDDADGLLVPGTAALEPRADAVCVCTAPLVRFCCSFCFHEEPPKPAMLPPLLVGDAASAAASGAVADAPSLPLAKSQLCCLLGPSPPFEEPPEPADSSLATERLCASCTPALAAAPPPPAVAAASCGGLRDAEPTPQAAAAASSVGSCPSVATLPSLASALSSTVSGLRGQQPADEPSGPLPPRGAVRTGGVPSSSACPLAPLGAAAEADGAAVPATASDGLAAAAGCCALEGALDCRRCCCCCAPAFSSGWCGVAFGPDWAALHVVDDGTNGLAPALRLALGFAATRPACWLGCMPLPPVDRGGECIIPCGKWPPCMPCMGIMCGGTMPGWPGYIIMGIGMGPLGPIRWEPGIGPLAAGIMPGPGLCIPMLMGRPMCMPMPCGPIPGRMCPMGMWLGGLWAMLGLAPGPATIKGPATIGACMPMGGWAGPAGMGMPIGRPECIIGAEPGTRCGAAPGGSAGTGLGDPGVVTMGTTTGRAADCGGVAWCWPSGGGCGRTAAASAGAGVAPAAAADASAVAGMRPRRRRRLCLRITLGSRLWHSWHRRRARDTRRPILHTRRLCPKSLRMRLRPARRLSLLCRNRGVLICSLTQVCVAANATTPHAGCILPTAAAATATYAAARRLAHPRLATPARHEAICRWLFRRAGGRRR
eukprot:303076-Chlamydomonas_euryale.AAC.1